MYKCINCNNERNFKENYYLKKHIIQDWDLISSYDENEIELFEVRCEKCSNNTEDKSILFNNELIDIESL